MAEDVLRAVATLDNRMSEEFKRLANDMQTFQRKSGAVTQDMTRQFAGLSQITTKVSSEFRTLLTPALTTFGITGGGLVATLTGMGVALEKFAGQARHIQGLSNFTGFERGFIDQIERAGERLHITSDQTDAMLKNVARLQLIMRNPASGEGQQFRFDAQLKGLGGFIKDLEQSSQRGNVRQFLEAIVTQMGKITDPALRERFAEKFLGDRELLRIARLPEALKEIVPIVERNDKAAEEYRKSVEKLGEQFENLGITISNKLYGPATQLAELFSKGLESQTFKNFLNDLNGTLTTTAQEVVAIVNALNRLQEFFDKKTGGDQSGDLLGRLTQGLRGGAFGPEGKGTIPPANSTPSPTPPSVNVPDTPASPMNFTPESSGFPAMRGRFGNVGLGGSGGGAGGGIAGPGSTGGASGGEGVGGVGSAPDAAPGGFSGVSGGAGGGGGGGRSHGAGVDAAIAAGAKEAGVDPSVMGAIADIESGFNPRSNINKRTQYKGLFQIGRQEWAKYGHGGNIYNAHDNAVAAGRMFRDHAAQFKKHFGRDPTPTELYMMHQQGLGFYTRGAMTNIAGNPYPGMHGRQTHESFERGWAARLNRGMSNYANASPHDSGGNAVASPHDSGAPFVGGSTATGADVRELQGKEAGIRRMPIQPGLRRELEFASSQTGLRADIFSGGQPGSGRHRTGSHRHDLGGAADLRLYQNGRLLDMRNPRDAALMSQFTEQAVAAGATGVGAGVHYMGPHGIHIGGGRANSWGGAGWVEQARRRGMSDRDRLGDHLRQQQQHQFTGNAKISVDVRAPKGTKVGTEADGMFKEIRTNRVTTMPMTPPL